MVAGKLLAVVVPYLPALASCDVESIVSLLSWVAPHKLIQVSRAV